MNDPREVFGKKSVAHVSLRDQFEADRYVDGTPMRVQHPMVKITGSPASMTREREGLFGDKVTVLEEANGRAFGRLERNGYVGHFAPSALGPWVEPTHWVQVRATFGFPEPDIKHPKAVSFSFGSQLAVMGAEDGFLRSVDGLYFPESHLGALDQTFKNPEDAARLFLDVPYLWGGNSVFGIDCSGLVQTAFNACGWFAKGDSDQQAKMAGDALSKNVPLEPGDLIFWKGHVALATGPNTMIHANAHHMRVVEEAIEPAIARINATDTGAVTLTLRPSRRPL